MMTIVNMTNQIAIENSFITGQDYYCYNDDDADGMCYYLIQGMIQI